MNPSPSATPVAARPQAAAAAAVVVESVSYSYGDRLALDALSLAVPRGSIFGLLGPNGSGKSTLLSLLIGRRKAEGGRIRALDEPLSPGLRARIGVVFQEPSLDPGMTVQETMLLQARLFGVNRADAGRRSMELLDRIGLAGRAGSLTATLSGGMKRRLELARALLPRPELILLDEPTLALDPDSRQALWSYLQEENARGCTLLLATNDVYEAERYCDSVALLAAGRVVAEGTPADLKRDLRDDSVRILWHHDPAGAVVAVEGWPGVGHVRLATRTMHVTVDDASAFLVRLFQEYGEQITGVHIEHSTLEDVYFQLVGTSIAGGIAPPRSEQEADDGRG